MIGRGIDREIASALALALFAGASAAANPLVDRQSSSPVTSLTREDLESLPTGRRIEDLVKTCPSTTFPTVTRDLPILVDGQPTSAPISIRCLAPTDLSLIEVYRTHNTARAEYGAPPLARDPLLELSAGEYVGQLARTGKMVHAPRAGRGNIRENISQGMPGWSAGQLLGSWVKEKKNFVPGTFPNVSRTGNWYDIGHWAQMIWIRTAVIGCARAAGIGATWMVCRYGPGGNKDGELVGIPPARPYLVEAPKLPDTEVFTPNNAKVATEPDGYRAPSLAGALSERVTGKLGYQGCFGDDSKDQIYGSLTLHFGDLPAECASPDLSLRNASFFDLGIYAGGAWTSDWFEAPDRSMTIDPIYSVDLEGPFAELLAEIFTLDEAEYFDTVDRLSGIQYLTFVAAISNNSSILKPTEIAEVDEVDTSVEQPTLPNAALYGPNGSAPKATKHDPSNPNRCEPGINFWTAEEMYKAAQSKGDQAGMLAAKGLMAAAIGRQWQTMEDSTEAGEMVSVSRYSLGDFLGKMMDGYKELTGELPPGFYESPNGFTTDIVPPDPAAPTLPTSEVFNPANLPNCPLDVM